MTITMTMKVKMKMKMNAKMKMKMKVRMKIKDEADVAWYTQQSDLTPLYSSTPLLCLTCYQVVIRPVTSM